MIDDCEIWACAHLLMKQHGDQVRFEVARRADELLAAGDRPGHRAFTRILNCIEQLERTEAAGSTQ